MRLTLRQIELEEGRISAADYETIAPWWAARGFTAPARILLPGLGVMIMQGDTPVACAFMYLDASGSGVCQLAWPATSTPGNWPSRKHNSSRASCSSSATMAVRGWPEGLRA